MSQLTGPVGLGPIEPHYYSGEYEKEQEQIKAAEQLQIQEKTKENHTDYEEQMLINTISELKLNLIVYGRDDFFWK